MDCGDKTKNIARHDNKYKNYYNFIMSPTNCNPSNNGGACKMEKPEDFEYADKDYDLNNGKCVLV